MALIVTTVKFIKSCTFLRQMTEVNPNDPGAEPEMHDWMRSPYVLSRKPLSHLHGGVPLEYYPDSDSGDIRIAEADSLEAVLVVEAKPVITSGKAYYVIGAKDVATPDDIYLPTGLGFICLVDPSDPIVTPIVRNQPSLETYQRFLENIRSVEDIEEIRDFMMKYYD